MNPNQTVSVIFWCYKSRESNGKAPLMCRITYNCERVQFGIRCSVNPKMWINELGMVKGINAEAKEINGKLDSIRREIMKHYNMMMAMDQFISAATLKATYFGVEEKYKGLIEIFQYHNDQMKELIGIDVVKATHTKFATVLSKLVSFLKKEKNLKKPMNK